MSRYLDQDELPRRAVREEPEREISLSTGTVLALFFVLALICAVFFGFGFSMGKKSAQSTAAELAASKATTGHAPETDDSAASTDTQPDTPEPAKQTPAVVISTPAPAHKPSAIAKLAPPEASSEDETPAASKPAVTKPAPAAAKPPTPTPAPTVASNIASNAAPTAAPTQAPGTTIVQIAAISHAEDAAMLVAALKRKGYAVTSHTYPDKLVHIQVGPYANKKDAEAMRQRLIADGYNAILK